jgi:hypothetical protein
VFVDKAPQDETAGKLLATTVHDSADSSAAQWPQVRTFA